MLMLLLQNNLQTDDPYMKTAENAFIRYSDMVFALAYSRCGANYSDAQDITGEVFYRLVRKKPEFESDEHMRAWLVRVTLNCTASMQTTAWHKNTVSLTESPVTQAMDEEDSEVYAAVLSLPVKLRTAIHLFYYEDYSVEDIAKAMGAKPNTVKSWLKRGRDSLRNKLKDEI